MLQLVHLLKCWLWLCRDSKQARREAVDMGVGRRSTYKMDNNGKRMSKAARLGVPGTRFDGAQVRFWLLFPAPKHLLHLRLLTHRPATPLVTGLPPRPPPPLPPLAHLVFVAALPACKETHSDQIKAASNAATVASCVTRLELCCTSAYPKAHKMQSWC